MLIGHCSKASVMRMTHSLRSPLALGVLLLAALVFSTSCSKLRYRAPEIPKSPVTWAAAYQQGRVEAKSDLAAGRLIYRTLGMPTTGDAIYAQHLRTHYNIELVKVAGCVASEELYYRTRGYNYEVLPHIEARYGKGILKLLHNQAIDEGKQKHPSR